MKELAQDLRRRREAIHLSRRRLAALAGTAESAIARLERGEVVPGIPTLSRIAAALGLELTLGMIMPSQAPPQPEPETQRRTVVLVADSQRLVSQGIAAALARYDDLGPVSLPSETGLASTGIEAAVTAIRVRPDVLLVDLWMPVMSGVAVCRALRAWAPEVNILVLSWMHGPSHIEEALAAGAAGFLPKTLAVSQVADAVRRAASGERPVFGSELSTLAETLKKRDEETHKRLAGVNSLTPREIDVLRVLNKGVTMEDAAAELSIAPGTLRIHLHHTMTKLNARSRLEALALAREAGVLGDPLPLLSLDREQVELLQALSSESSPAKAAESLSIDPWRARAETRRIVQTLGVDSASKAIHAAQTAGLLRDSPATYMLSPDEFEIVRLLAQGHSMTQLSRILSLSKSTLGARLKRILNKTGAANAAEAVAVVRRQGLLDI